MDEKPQNPKTEGKAWHCTHASFRVLRHTQRMLLQVITLCSSVITQTIILIIICPDVQEVITKEGKNIWEINQNMRFT